MIENNVPLVLLSKEEDISVKITAHDSPVWRIRLWIDKYEKYLSFMADDDLVYPQVAVVFKDVLIDHEKYLRVYRYEHLRESEMSWMVDPEDSSALWLHFKNHNPPTSFLSMKVGIAYGFSYGKSLTMENIKTYPALLDFPNTEDKADNFVYQQMRFSSGNIIIDNSDGNLDSFLRLFGNSLSLYNYKNNKPEIIREFFINSYNIGLTQVKLNVQDKRGRLTTKAPNTFYTEEKYRFIDKNLIDKVIQDAYGYCVGVTGTCLNRNQIYGAPSYLPGTTDQNAPESAFNFNDWYQFKFARTITSIDEVWVKKSDIWTQIFPGLGIPDKDNPNFTNYQTVNPQPIKIIITDKHGVDTHYDVVTGTTNLNNKQVNNEEIGTIFRNNDGRIAIWHSQAMKDNPGFLFRRNGDAETVKMTGVFVNKHTAGEIVKDLLEHYGDMPYIENYINVKEWDKEMISNSKEIGICLDQSDDIFGWIEKIQNGSLIGFQIVVNKDLFSARIDHPNRKESFEIKYTEIINRDQLEPELNGDVYATYTKINYLLDYTDKIPLTIVDKSQRFAVMDVYKFEREYLNDSYLTAEEDVILKGNIILEQFTEARPLIIGIELEGLRENEIELFSTGFIDFNLPLPRNMKAIQKYMNDRRTLGKLRVKALGWKRDYKTNRITIDVIQQPYSAYLPRPDILVEFEDKIDLKDDFYFEAVIKKDFEDKLNIIDEFSLTHEVDFVDELKHYSLRNRSIKRDGTRKRRKGFMMDTFEVKKQSNEFTDRLELKGELQFEVYEHGELVREFVDHNLIVDNGRELVTKLLAEAGAPRAIGQISFGNNNMPESVYDTEIIDGYVKPIKSFEYPALGQVLFNFELEPEENNGEFGTGVEICEFGLLTVGGTLFARRVIDEPIQKKDYTRIIGRWRILV